MIGWFIYSQDGGIDIHKEMERLHKKINKLEANKDELSVKLEKLDLKGKGDQSSALKLKDKVSSNFCLSDKDAMQHNRH